MKKFARVIVTKRCPRNCPGCCNTQFKFDGDVSEITHEALDEYEYIVITGGEPLLVRKELDNFIERHKDKQLILYTSYSTLINPMQLMELIYKLSGITFTVHYEDWLKDIKELAGIQSMLSIVRLNGHEIDARLSIDSRIPLSVYNFVASDSWSSVKRFEWLEPNVCAVPQEENLFYMPLD